ncbi:MAG: hypothetical protein AABW89_03500 [Nanoarchaeota archaeon]
MKKRKVNKSVMKKKTSPKIIITSLVALGFIALALLVHWSFIIPALILWWINKKSIKKHFKV